MATLDRIIGIRVASFPVVGAAAHAGLSAEGAALTAPDAIWADGSASVIETSSQLDANGNDTLLIRALNEGWQGADGPAPAHVMTRSGSGQGEARRAKKWLGRGLTMPLCENVDDTGSVTQKERLDLNVIPVESYVIGFQRAVSTDSRYLISCVYEGGLDRSYRGEQHRSNFRLRSRSQHPWFVRPRSSASPATFTPSGIGDILWGVSWSSAVPSPLTVSLSSTALGNTASTYTWAASGEGVTVPARGIITESFPFEEHTNNPAISGTSPVPQYLVPGQSYTVTAAGCTVWWLENYMSL